MEGEVVAISYNKLWKLLIDKKMSKSDLRKAAKIAPNTMTKLGVNGNYFSINIGN